MDERPDISSARPVEILLVEDNPADVEITRQGFRKGKIANNLHIAMDAEEAMAFLRREGSSSNAPRPDLILLDLNLPGRDGRELLSDIKSDKDLGEIPVVILTTSNAESDIRQSYKLHANAFMTKPVDFTQFVEMVQSISSYWFSLVLLPPKEDKTP